MTVITKATPRPVFTGWRDESGTQLPVEREQLPQHLPLYMIQTERGPLTTQMLSGAELLRMYGSKSFDERSKFFSHQSMAAKVTNSAANSVMIKRMVDPTAQTAAMALTLEVTPKDFDHYLRNADNSVQRDVGGVKQVDTGNSISGYELTWKLVPATAGSLKTLAIVTPGPNTTGTGASTVYPIAAFEVASPGAFGNNVGLRLSVPNEKSSAGPDTFAIEDQLALLYRLQFVERPDALSTPIVTETLGAERTIDFAIKSGVINTKTTQSYDRSVILDAYRNKAEGTVPVFGPMGNFHIYDGHIATILALLNAAEDTARASSGVPRTAIEAAELINIFTAIDYQGIEQYGLRMATDTIAFDSNTTHYCLGGTDGAVSEADLDTYVKTALGTMFTDLADPLGDRLRFPFSALYDTGFSIDTKKAFLATLGDRPDIHVAVCTQDMSGDENSAAAESSMASALRAAARMIPESVIHGTEVCRAVITQSMGEFTDSETGRRLPLLLDLIKKRSQYMGAGDGRMKTAKAYDRAPNNRVTTMVDVTHTWAPQVKRDEFWELGLNYVQYGDRSNLIWPAFQTVYSDDTSILNSEVLMQIMVDITKICEYVWVNLTGDTTLTQAQFIEASNDLFNEQIVGRYDSRVTIVPTTYFTEADDVRGYSWTMDVAVYGNTMKTVGTYNIIARRAVG